MINKISFHRLHMNFVLTLQQLSLSYIFFSECLKYFFSIFSLMPFGAGRRVCAGEAMARNRMFLFITTLLQRFHFLPDPDEPLPECDPNHYKNDLILHPTPFKVIAKPRNSQCDKLSSLYPPLHIVQLKRTFVSCCYLHI